MSVSRIVSCQATKRDCSDPILIFLNFMILKNFWYLIVVKLVNRFI